MSDPNIPFTERRNELSVKLDGSLSAICFLKTLRSCDSQIYTGYAENQNIFDKALEIDATIRGCSLSSKVIITGCGTSGRLAFLTCRRYSRLFETENTTLRKPAFVYTIAGGDSAILLSDELPEDDPVVGCNDMVSQLDLDDSFDEIGTKECLGYLIGVTCGLSAPYVAGQAAKVLSTKGVGMSLIGFNPAELARNVPLTELEGKSFRDIAITINKISDRAVPIYLLNPVIGPEPVAGSSRMKGGTATLIILDIICLKTCKEGGFLHSNHPLYNLAALSVTDLLCEYQRCHALTYSACMNTLPKIMEASSKAIRMGGHIYYIGSESAAILGCIDASEMPDTYGAPFDQIRAFVSGGWTTLDNYDGDLSSCSRLHRIGLDHFIEDIFPSLTSKDSVIVLISSSGKYANEEVVTVAHMVKKTDAIISYLISSSQEEDEFLLNNPFGIKENTDLYSFVKIPIDHDGFHDLAIKLMTNAVSTYSQAAGRGAIYKSFMISTGPANDKIYSRCIDLISSNLNVSKKDANVSIIRSVYGVDVVDKALLEAPRSECIKAALLSEDKRNQSQIILPVAFLLASSPSMSVQAAREAVISEPRLDLLLEKVFMQTVKEKNTFSSETYAVGIDIGGTNIRAAVINPQSGAIVADVVKEKVLDKSLEGFLKLLGDVYDSVASKFKSPPLAIGVGQPGHIDDNGCVSKMANYPEWGDRTVPIKSFLQKRSGCEHVALFNDADALLAAEVFYGAGRLASTVAMITIGTGIGCAFAHSSGQMFRGARGLVEGGHSIIDFRPAEARLCGCGQRGCLEMYCSGPAIARSAAESGLGNITAEEVVRLAASSDPIAESVLAEASRYLAIGVLNSLRYYDPDVLVLGGGLSSVMIERVKAELLKLQWKIHDDRRSTPIVCAECDEPGCQGAAALAIKNTNRSTAETSPPALRRAVESDREALYAVCLHTGDSGKNGAHLFTDYSLLGSIYVGPYLSLSNFFAFCLVENTIGVGYILGVLDTLAFDRLCHDQWWPRLRKKYSLESLHNFNVLEQNLIKNQIHARPTVDSDILQKYPSHMHIDLIGSVQGKGYGSIMLRRLIYSLTEAGSNGVHLTMFASNTRALCFYKKFGFQVIKEIPDSGELVLGLSLSSS